ncbi:MAG: cytochrome-c peroxidase [Bacteroidetes bacterium]|nr:cytochrome-c peroxidase [Bacteroidota bacterium]
MGRIYLMNKKPFLLLVTASVFLFWHCNKKEKNEGTHPYQIAVPRNFPSPFLNPENPMTTEGVELGRRLFYEYRLSGNGRSCNSCHLQEKAFMISNVSLGLDPAKYNNIPSLVNLAWNPDYNWNGYHKDLDHVAIGDFGPDFFNSDIHQVISTIAADKSYQTLYKQVFSGTDVFTPGVFEEKTAFAIAQFLRSIVSANSKFDKFVAGKGALTNEEKYGYEIFSSEKGDCFHCHAGSLTTDNSYHNIGLDSVFTLSNSGRAQVTFMAKDIGLYSTPSLRNAALTAPYMHDGRFATLDEVIEHYNSGVRSSATLDPIMTKNNKQLGLKLSSYEKFCLKAFLVSLTDSNLLVNPAYSRPQ